MKKLEILIMLFISSLFMYGVSSYASDNKLMNNTISVVEQFKSVYGRLPDNNGADGDNFTYFELQGELTKYYLKSEYGYYVDYRQMKCIDNTMGYTIKVESDNGISIYESCKGKK